MVVSGINLGANMGDDTIYSGTVAAATEGYLLGVPSIAISLAQFRRSAFRDGGANRAGTGAAFQRRAVCRAGAAQRQCPDIPYEELRGIRVTRLGRRHKAEPAVKSVSPRGETMYWMGAAGPAADAGEGTDFHAVEHGWVSVTPLQIDLTHAAQMGERSQLARPAQQ
jgi:5'-nucleotidase